MLAVAFSKEFVVGHEIFPWFVWGTYLGECSFHGGIYQISDICNDMMARKKYLSWFD